MVKEIWPTAGERNQESMDLDQYVRVVEKRGAGWRACSSNEFVSQYGLVEPY